MTRDSSTTSTFEPGQEVPESGWYIERDLDGGTGRTVELEAGDRFPVVNERRFFWVAVEPDSPSESE